MEFYRQAGSLAGKSKGLDDLNCSNKPGLIPSTGVGYSSNSGKGHSETNTGFLLGFVYASAMSIRR